MNENEENKKAEISEISGKTRKDRGKKDFLNFLNQLTFKLFQTAGYSRRMLRFVSCSLLTTENALSLSSPPRLYSKCTTPSPELHIDRKQVHQDGIRFQTFSEQHLPLLPDIWNVCNS